MTGMGMEIEVPAILLLTTFTGSLGLLLWRFLGRLLVKWGYVRWYYGALRAVVLLFLIPFVYLGVDWINQNSGRWGGTFLVETPEILLVCRGSCLLWALGALLVAAKFILQAVRLARRIRRSFACKSWEQQMFADVCREMGIPEGRVRLRRNYGTETACLAGVFRPRVLLGAREYTGEELRMILLHELTHYRQKDILLKRLAMLIVVLQYFNPMVWWLSRLVNRWSEFACDARVCERTKDPKAYFSCLVGIAERISQGNVHFSVQLLENKNELAERIKHMKKIHKIKRKPVGAAVLISVVLFFSGSATVMAATDGAARLYQSWFEATDVLMEEPVQKQAAELTEYTAEAFDSGVKVEVGETTALTRSISSFEWTVPESSIKTTGEFYVKEGQRISVTVQMLNHTDQDLMIGIVRPTGVRSYVKGSGTISHEFEAYHTGYYKVYVQNANSVAIDVEGAYMYN